MADDKSTNPETNESNDSGSNIETAESTMASDELCENDNTKDTTENKNDLDKDASKDKLNQRNARGN